MLSTMSRIHPGLCRKRANSLPIHNRSNFRRIRFQFCGGLNNCKLLEMQPQSTMKPGSTRTMKMHQQVLHCPHRAIGFFVCSNARGHYTAMSCFVPDCSAAYIDGPVLAHIHGTFGGGGGKVLDSTDN